MYLKSIEIQGFKSFANRILFEFHNGITGIVGPNGSGKSNVADAVRWVLGEQRAKQLRGGSMQDVIFSGTELRKPQGFAYVAITLDNSDQKLPVSFREVTISRRLYRSGESEYKMNGTPCRLKDIQELFYDTGIGKEGYSIIGQGQIDKILSGRPEERRELFDEAAGIVKFKRRKLIAQKKLESEKQNLLRVTDILAELEKQVEPLRCQSETAREYLRLRDELKVYDSSLFFTESAVLNEQIRAIEEKEEIVSGDLEDMQIKSGQLKAEYEALSLELETLEQELSRKRDELSRSELLRQTLEGQIGVLNEQIHTERLNEEHIRSRAASIEQDFRKKEAQAKEYQKEREQLFTELVSAREAFALSEQRLKEKETEIAETEQQIERAKTDILTALHEKAELAAKKQRYETMLEQADIRRAELSQKLLKVKSDESVQEEQLKEKEEALLAVRQMLKELEERETALSDEAAAAEAETKRLNRVLNQAQQEYHTSRTKQEALKNLAERYDGYGGSIRRVMEVRDRVKGIHGVVADLISTEKKYETAIETALGGAIQNIVTDSEQTAKQLIEYLKKNRYGRATFLPLTSMKNQQAFAQTAALREPGVLGLASTLVKTEEVYRDLAASLLGRVVVVDQIDHAIALARKFRYSLRIVTLDGELFSAGGSMTGGAFKNNSNLLGRKRELKELEETGRQAMLQVQKLHQELALQEGLLQEAKDRLITVQEEKQRTCLHQNTIQLQIRQLESRKQEIADSSADLVLENQDLEMQLSELRTERERLLAETEALELLGQNKEKESEEASAALEQLKQEHGQEFSALSELQLKVSALGQKDTFLAEHISRISEEKAALLEEQRELSRGGTESGETIAAKEEEIRRLLNRIEEEKERGHQMKTALQEHSRRKEEKNASQKGFFEQKEELSQRISLLDREQLRLQNQKEKLSERIETQAQYMWNEYELTAEQAKQLKDPLLTSLPELRRLIEERKNQIRALGHVNVNAIEDYKETAQRYEFMKTQHDDLAAAEAALLTIIDELDCGMRRQFEEKFGEIRKEFDQVFQELFGGGHGRLELSEDEDILEAGIQIISQPPGKKLQHMMQLSGGEKALTAIALLFAIQNLKPSPFCLLDEIEAALDDSNVDRFAGYLHKLTKDTQFIVITHRRGTMVSSDRLYGITMQEKGVSALVSVSLIEAELEQEEKQEKR